MWIGILPTPPKEFDEKKVEELTARIHEQYKCIPIFVDKEVIMYFLKEVCYALFDPVMSNTIGFKSLNVFNYKDEMFEKLKEMSNLFASYITHYSNRHSSIMITDYRLCLVCS